MIVPHCLFILPADVISSCWLWPLTCHLPPIVAMVQSTLVAAVQENIPVFISVGFLCLQEGHWSIEMQNLFVLKGHFSFGILISSFILISHFSLATEVSFLNFSSLIPFSSLCPYNVFSCCLSLVWQKDCTSFSWQGMAIIHNASTMFKWLISWLLNVFQQQLWQIATMSHRALAVLPHHLINGTDKTEQNLCHYT